MNRRRFVAAAGTTSLTGLAGCTQRVTGWSSLRVRLDNGLDRAATLQFTIEVDGTASVGRVVDLDPEAFRTFEADVDVPWGATLGFTVEHVEGDAAASDRWAATVPLWGGDKCMIEPVAQLDEDGLSVGPACVG